MKKLLIILSVSSLILMTLNFVLLLHYSDRENIGLLATILSGWVSGLATLAVGIIAALQSKKYNDANNDFVKKQYELEQSKSIIQSRMLFVDNLKKGWHDFSSNCNPLYLSVNVAPMCAHKSTDINKLYIYTSNFLMAIRNNYSLLCDLLLIDYHETTEKEKAKKSLDEYKNSLSKIFEQKNLIDKYFGNASDFYKLIMDNFMKKYSEVNQEFNKYILKCDLDINFSISNKINDIEYLKKQYSPKQL